MTSNAGVSARSLLAAGMAAAAIGTVALTPVTAGEHAVRLASPAVALTSLGTDIKALYNAVEPWAAYGAEVATYALGFVPALWWVAPGINLAYFSIEPLVQAGVYSFADAIDLNFAQIPIDINAGINESLDNFVTFGLAWIGSLVPIPPLPPLPPFPGASVATGPGASSLSAARRSSVPSAPAATASGTVTDGNAAPVVETVETAQDLATPIAVAAPSPRRQASRVARTGQSPASPAQSAAAQTERGDAGDTAPGGADASAGTGAPGKAQAGRASRAAGRAG